ncbi:U1 small nuclear ribonucleoprotein C-2-like [Homarus americanus]|uniref:U1 small nuclear ribonucleoprotein C-2-like n=1 Tax=Homarus americanus TaxID=6706 RepID=UPI001C44D54D|nr:U1 small nuclear ribonucleoprotein C-2-like [Homarus americanus]
MALPGAHRGAAAPPGVLLKVSGTFKGTPRGCSVPRGSPRAGCAPKGPLRDNGAHRSTPGGSGVPRGDGVPRSLPRWRDGGSSRGLPRRVVPPVALQGPAAPPGALQGPVAPSSASPEAMAPPGALPGGVAPSRALPNASAPPGAYPGTAEYHGLSQGWWHPQWPCQGRWCP